MLIKKTKRNKNPKKILSETHVLLQAPLLAVNALRKF
jgi:hypothetical protein